MRSLKFSAWSKWENRNDNLPGLKLPGIYALKLDNRNVEGSPFQLVPSIVYFGMTNAINGLGGRLAQFNNTMWDKSGGGHGGADRFRFDYTGEELNKILYVSVFPFELPDEKFMPERLIVNGNVAKAEFIAFAEYYRKYSKLPKYNDKKNSPKNSKR